MRVLLEIREGKMAAHLLDNGLARILAENGCDVLVVTPAARVPYCVDRWAGERIELRHISPLSTMGRLGSYEMKFGRWLSTRRHVRLRRFLWQIVGERDAARRAVNERLLIEECRPDVVVASHLAHAYGRGLVAVANRLGIPTVGNLVSWDNAYRPLRVRPRKITCWSEQNRQELTEMCAYCAEEIEVIGAPAFDAYFAPDAQWSREKLCHRVGLDPGRPIILFATLGQMNLLMDETSSFEIFLQALDSGAISGNPQVVLRLHPVTRDAFFAPFSRHKNVKVSRYEGYIPWMAWTPWRDEIVLAGNLLRHADVCISPGSTMTIEASIFDTPTVMPILNAYQPETYNDFIDRIWLRGHFKPMIERSLLPVAYTSNEFVKLVNKALADRSWFRKERREIREMLLGPLDGKATERLAKVILAEGRGGAGAMM